MIKQTGLIALALLTSACGFTPAYAPASMDGSAVSIPEIKGRAGHFLRQELVHSLGNGVPGMPGSSTFEIELNENVARLGFAPDQAASRSDYIATAYWTLRDASGTVISKGVSSEAASFNFADAPYADISAQSAAQERVAILLARNIREQILLDVGKPKTDPANP